MENNATEFGSRITRSLRKRLTSVDDNTSRPGTPVPTKLTSISEISSPNTSTRMTRRVSSSGIATPVKTPAKRVVATSGSVENLENITPARRSSRKRSISVHENEETSQSKLQVPKFPTLDEEVVSNDTKTSTLSISVKDMKSLDTSIQKKDKSLNKTEYSENKMTGPMKRKAGPKCKTRSQKEYESDVEVSALEEEIEDIKNNSSNNTIPSESEESKQIAATNVQETKDQVDSNKSIVKEDELGLPHDTITDKENTSTVDELELKENITESRPSISSTEQNTLKDVPATNVEITEISLNESNQQEKSEVLSASSEKGGDAEVEKQNLSISCDKQKSEELRASSEKEGDAEVEKQNLSIPYDKQETVAIEKDTIPIENKPICDEITVQENETNLTVTGPVEMNTDLNENNHLNMENCLAEETQETKETKSASNRCEIISVTTLISVDDGSADVNDNKKLKFLSSPSNDMIMKTVYPKTPASTKASNSIKKISLTQDEENQKVLHDSKNKIEETQAAKAEISTNLSSEFANASENLRNSILANTMSKCEEEPLQTVETEGDSNAKHLNTLEKSVDKESKEIKEPNKESNNDVGISPNQTKEEIKWVNPSVKGTIENGSKLDFLNIQDNTNSIDCTEYKDIILEQIPKGKKKNIFSPETEDEEEDDENSNELAPGEEPYKRKHEFHDDEVMEVDDYESGDSMDSEERRELEENEVPIDAESIGSQTTEDAMDECEEDEENNSFIVSDGEELQFSESENEEDVKVKEQLDSDFLNDSNNDRSESAKCESARKTNASRLQDEKSGTESEDLHTKSKSCESMTDINNSSNNSNENIILETSKLSDSALRLYCTPESGSEEENNEENLSICRQVLLRNMNQSDRFNKSVRNLNQSREMVQDDTNEGKSFDEGHSTSTTPGESSNESRNDGTKLQSESHLGEVSVTSESDGDKENEHKNAYSPSTDTGLSASFDNGKKLKQRPELQRSFTIDVTVKDGELETTVADVKLIKSTSISFSPTDDIDTDEALEGEDTKHLENIKLMSLPLGNPLIRTRRQSLALPTNPDMAICSSSSAGGTSKKETRKSLGAFPNIDFKPSQSFIDSINLQKSDSQKQVEKRKRLSKSFCGAPDTHDNSIIDIDVRHLHKKSKLTDEPSMAESHLGSVEDVNASKIFTKISSTPYEKNVKDNSFDKKERILRRCDEILEAANSAKLEAKIKNRKTKISKKLSQKNSGLTTLEKTNHDDLLRGVSKEIKRKDKTKAALSQAIKTGDSQHGIKKKSQQNKNEKNMLEAKRLPADVLETIGKLDTIKKKTIKEKIANLPTSSTSAGKVVELPQSPEKKKKKTYIQLSTGKVSVEPITPKKRTVQTANGLQFRESPVTPRVVGLKVHQIKVGENNVSSSSGLIEKKKKRSGEGSPKECTSLKSQWTQSGPFIEEELPTNRQIAQHEIPHSKSETRKVKKGIREMEEQSIKHNFKESALMRPDIERSTKREILLIRERRQNNRGHFY